MFVVVVGVVAAAFVVDFDDDFVADAAAAARDLKGSTSWEEFY